MNESRPNPLIETVEPVVADAVRHRVAHLSTRDERLDGRTIRIARNGSVRDLVFFGSCSYLGLELHPALIAGAKAAAETHGCQFSSSRAYVSVGLYDELEELFARIFRGHPLIVSPTTTLGHMAALPVLLAPDDALILDQQVHASVQTAGRLAKHQGTHVTVVPHNNLDRLEGRLRRLRARHRRIWLAVDGVYSMFGDVPPLEQLTELMDSYPQLHLYIDDAHGMSWAGEMGCGLTLSRLGRLNDRMVMATSLAKGFGCGGGVLVFGREEWARQVRACGGPMVYSGPIQPPTLGAAIASAGLHVDGTLDAMQEELRCKTLWADQALRESGLPLLSNPGIPILFVPVGLPRRVYEILEAMMDDGFYLDAGVFPATPMTRGGVRMTITRHLSEADISSMAERLSHHVQRVLAAHGSSLGEVARHFRLEVPDGTPASPESRPAPPESRPASPESRPAPLRSSGDAGTRPERDGSLTHERDIRRMDRDTWDRLLGTRGSFDWNGVRFQQDFFQSPDRAPENRWSFHYVRIDDAEGTPVLLTFFTVALAKEDMLSDAAVSSKVEELRGQDPYYLSSKIVMLGSLLSEGRHLYLDLDHPAWRQALGRLLTLMNEVRQQEGASAVILRDFDSEDHDRLQSACLGLGFTSFRMPDSFMLDHPTPWQDDQTFVRRQVEGSYRRLLRRQVLERQDVFDVTVTSSPVDQELLAALYRQYLAVREGKLTLNTFPLPDPLFSAFNEDPSWEFLLLYLSGDESPRLAGGQRAPVAFALCYTGSNTYEMLIVGLDYDFVHTTGCYKQLLFQCAKRGAQRAGRTLMGFTGALPKRTVGARRVPTFGFVQLDDHYSQDLLRTL